MCNFRRIPSLFFSKTKGPNGSKRKESNYRAKTILDKEHADGDKENFENSSTNPKMRGKRNKWLADDDEDPFSSGEDSSEDEDYASGNRSKKKKKIGEISLLVREVSFLAILLFLTIFLFVDIPPRS